MPIPAKTKKIIIIFVAIIFLGSMVLVNVPPSTQQGQLRNSGSTAPAHVTIKQYLAEGTSEKSARVVEVSPYCVPDWAIAGQWILSVTQPFRLEGLPFFAKKFGAPGEDSRLGREFALLVSTNPDDPESVIAEASNIDSGERTIENFWLEFGEGVELEPGDYYLTLLFGPDYMDGKLDTTYNATVALDKESQTPAWGRFLEGNVKVTRKSELLTFGKLSFPLKIDQNVADHSLPECREGDWLALTDDEYYGVEEEIAEEELGEEPLSEEEWSEDEEKFWAEGDWPEEVETEDRSENLLQSFEASAEDAVWVEEESVDTEAGESEVKEEEKKEEKKIKSEPLKTETKQEESVKSIEPTKPAEPIKASTPTNGTTDSKDSKTRTSTK